jgi:hypothetical protein
MNVRKARPVAHQPADVDKFAYGIDHGQRVARGQRNELRATVDKKRVGTDHQYATGLLHEFRKDRINLKIGAGVKDLNWQTKSGRVEIFDDEFGQRRVGG